MPYQKWRDALSTFFSRLTSTPELEAVVKRLYFEGYDQYFVAVILRENFPALAA